MKNPFLFYLFLFSSFFRNQHYQPLTWLFLTQLVRLNLELICGEENILTIFFFDFSYFFKTLFQNNLHFNIMVMLLLCIVVKWTQPYHNLIDVLKKIQFRQNKTGFETVVRAVAYVCRQLRKHSWSRLMWSLWATPKMITLADINDINNR